MRLLLSCLALSGAAQLASARASAQPAQPTSAELLALCEQQGPAPAPTERAAGARRPARGPGLAPSLAGVRARALALLPLRDTAPYGTPIWRARNAAYAQLERSYNALGSAVTRTGLAPPPGDAARVALALLSAGPQMVFDERASALALLGRALRWVRCGDALPERRALCLGLLRAVPPSAQDFALALQPVAVELRAAAPGDAEVLGLEATLLESARDFSGAAGAWRARAEARAEGAPQALLRARVDAFRVLLLAEPNSSGLRALEYAATREDRARAEADLEALAGAAPPEVATRLRQARGELGAPTPAARAADGGAR